MLIEDEVLSRCQQITVSIELIPTVVIIHCKESNIMFLMNDMLKVAASLLLLKALAFA